MRRLTSVFTHTVLMTFVAVPAMAQSTPPPSNPVESTVQRSAVAPTPAPPGRGQQPGQGQPGQMTPPAAAPRPEPRAPSIGSQGNVPMGPVNIKLDLAVTDNYSGTPIKKTVSLMLLNGYNGMIRTTNYGDGNAVLNVDAIASAYQNGQISLRLTFEYVPSKSKENTSGRPATLNESITVVLQDGKPLVVSQSADPATDRKVTTELTATILK